MANSTVNLQTPGLYPQPNQLNVPEGALAETNNVVIDRDNIIEPRRGYGLYGNPFGTSLDRLKQLFVYKFRLFRQWGSTLEFDTGTINNDGQAQFEPFSGTFNEAQEGLRTKSVESNGNFYFTSSEGIKKISAASASDLTTDPGYVVQAGAPKALDISSVAISPASDSNGFLPPNSTVAYRAVWGYQDLNKNLILGVPSNRAEVYYTGEEQSASDFNALVNSVQNIATAPTPNNSLIDLKGGPVLPPYTDLLVSPVATSADILVNAQTLAKQVDYDTTWLNSTSGETTFLTDDTGTTGVPAWHIQNNTNDLTQNLCTVIFSVGDPNQYAQLGSNIFINTVNRDNNDLGNGETGNINGLQVVSAITTNSLSFLTSATGNDQIFFPSNVNTGTDTITLTAHGYKNFDPVVFFPTVGSTLPAPLASYTGPSNVYYIGNVTTDTFQLFSGPDLAAVVDLTTTGIGSFPIQFWITQQGNLSIASGELESVTVPATPDIPATGAENAAVETYILALTAKLNAMPAISSAEGPAMINAAAKTEFLTPVVDSQGEFDNVKVTVTIPRDVTTNDFLQLYRSPILTATDVAVLANLTASDELQQVYEGFPTAQDIANGFITVIDESPDAFLGTDLYTNEQTGVGIANANEPLPFALDINKFQNVVFYANTRTRYRMSLQLLGVSKMITDAQNGIIPQLVVTDGEVTNIYSFVLGISQVTSITTVADTTDSLNGTYFLLNSADNTTEYYVWYKTSGGTSSDPLVAGRTGIEVFINTNDTADAVASKTANAIIVAASADFTPIVAADVITITNNNEGISDTAEPATSGFTVTTTTAGNGAQQNRQTGHFLTVADTAGSLAGEYFTVNSAFDQVKYVIWYNVSGSGLNPGIPNTTPIEIMITTGDSADVVAQKTAAQLNDNSNFIALNPSTNQLTVSPSSIGPAAPATVGTSGFTLVSSDAGHLNVLLSQDVSPAEAIAETSQSFLHALNTNPSETVYGYYLSQSSTIPGDMDIESRNLTTPQFYIVANNDNTGSSFTPDISPTLTISSITPGTATTNLVTTTTPHGMTSGNQVVITGTDSTPSDDGLFSIKFVTATSFRLNATIAGTATEGGATPTVQATQSDDEAKINRIYFSQFQQPEAVPLGNTIDVGDQDKPILRIFPLRDSLFVFKEDGLFRISGSTGALQSDIFDKSAVLLAPDSIGLTKNLLFGWFNQGILSVSESGTSNPSISRPIDNLILSKTPEVYPGFLTSTWGMGYDSDNSYTIFTTNDISDETATIAYRYNSVTTSWTTWDHAGTCGVIDIKDDKMYLGPTDINFVEQERKNFNRFDYADREIDLTLDDGDYFGTTLKLSDVSQIKPGDVLIQNQLLSIFDYNSLLLKLDGDIGLLTSTIASITTGLTPVITTTADHGLSTDDFVTLSQTATTPLINGVYQVTVLSSTTFRIILTSPILTPHAGGIVKFSYYNTYQLVSGSNLHSGIIKLVDRLNVDPNLTYRTQSYNITSVAIGSPAVMTLSTSHDLGDIGVTRVVSISGDTSTPSINGNHVVTILSPTTLSIPITVTVAGTGGTLSTIDDYVTATSAKSGSISNISIDDPTIITSDNHGLVYDRNIQISASNSTPTIDGHYTIMLIDVNSFSIPINVTIEGSSGSFQTNDTSFDDLLATFNYIISLLNNDGGTTFTNYMEVTVQTSQETIIETVNKAAKEITVALPLEFVSGPFSVFQSINSGFTYCPVTFKDTLGLKQIFDATLMFENKAFSEATLSFASDLQPQFIDIPFLANGNGNFGMGTGPFGGNFFGGAANAAPFRTLIPRPCQRCRFIVPKFNHSIALEKYSINGLTLTGNVGLSQRAYR